MDLAWNLEFAFFPHVYQQLCCDPDNQLSLSPRYSLLCSLLQKTLPCLVQLIYSPSSEPPWATKKGIIPVSLAGCEERERLGAESQLRGRSGFTSKTWVTSSFKGGTGPFPGASSLITYLLEDSQGLPLGFATKKREPKCQT